MAKQTERNESLAMDVIRHCKKRLYICRVALAVSLIGNVVLAAALILR